MSTKTIVLNEGSQKAFVANEAAASGYIGGIGSGKTFSGIAKGLKLAQQPLAEGSMFGPRGLIGAASFRVLRTIIIPQFMDIMSGTGLWKTGRRADSWVKSEMKANLIANCGCDDPHTCDHVTEIFLASLDDPNELRGMELSWFFIDEGRNTTREAWDVLWGRLRQRGYKHQGWVCSTPNGYDWMYDILHEESTSRIPDSEWFDATSLDNPHTGDDYKVRLSANFSGRYYEQEVLGRFLGVTEGAVFFEWDPSKSMEDVAYRDDLPLYSEWDFGFGDMNVVLFFQMTNVRREVAIEEDGHVRTKTIELPVKWYLGAMEANKRTSATWAIEFTEYSLARYGIVPKQNFGDPAGMQTQQTSGTSVIADLGAHGVIITPAAKMAPDYAARILNNMMADGRVKVDRKNCLRLSKAFAAHKWPTDASGNRKGNSPVHDWTSHYCDAARYGTTVLIRPFADEVPDLKTEEFQPSQYGYVFQQVLQQAEDAGSWLGQSDELDIKWVPTAH